MKSLKLVLAAAAILAVSAGLGCSQSAGTSAPSAEAAASGGQAEASQPAMMGLSSTAGGAPDSGIVGRVVAAWGNMPARAPTTQCVTVFDASGQKTIASGACTGAFQQFRVPLQPGTYTVRIAHGNLRKVVVQKGQWVTLNPAGGVGHVP